MHPNLSFNTINTNSLPEVQCKHHCADIHVHIAPTHFYQFAYSSSSCPRSLCLASLFTMSRPMSHPTRNSVIAALLLLLFLLFVSCSHGSSDSKGLRVRSIAKRTPGYLMGFLPRGVPIPPSGPSRKHNSIGLQNKAQPWSSGSLLWLNLLSHKLISVLHSILTIYTMSVFSISPSFLA